MALGLGAGGAAAAGLQSGFEMGRQVDQDAQRTAQLAHENARQTQLDAERRDQIARQNKQQDVVNAEHEDDRAYTASGVALEDARFSLGSLHNRYPDGQIPDSEAKPLYEAIGQAHATRQALIAKRYQPVIDATTQKWRDFASKAQVGQADPSQLRGQDLRDFIKATTGHDLSEFANGNITGAVNDTTTGMQTSNQGMMIRGAGVLMGPQVRQGIGGIAPDGSQIVNKDLHALVPAPRQPLPQPPQSPLQAVGTAITAAAAPPPAPAAPAAPAAPGAAPSDDSGPGDATGPVTGAPVAAAPATPATPAAPAGPGAPDPALAASPNQQAVPDSDPSKVIPVLEVTTRQPDGTLTKYHAPVTDGRSTDPNAAIAGPLDTQNLMDRMGRLGVVDNWLKTPEMAGAVQEALKDGSPTNFDQAWGMVHGDPNAFKAKDPTSLKIQAIRELAAKEGLSFEEAARVFDAKGQPKGVQVTLDAIENSDLTPAEKDRAKKVALKIAPAAGVLKNGGSSALGGALPPDAGATQNQTVDFWAKAVLAGDKDWQVGLSRSKSGAALIEAVKRRVPGMATELGLTPQDIGTARAQNAALGSTLKDLTKRQAAVEMFSSKTEKDMNTFNALLDKAGSNSPLIINEPINALRRKFSDSDLAQLDLAAKQVGTEYERLITGGTLSVAQLHSGAADDAKKLINGDMPPKQARAVMAIMRTEMGNARAAANESTARIQLQMRALGNAPLGGNPPTLASPPAKAGGAAQFENGKVYQDAKGNKATYNNGTWTPL